MKKDKFRQNYAIEVRNALYDIEHNGIEKINRNGKSEIESISIWGENVLMNDILNNIYYFNENRAMQQSKIGKYRRKLHFLRRTIDSAQQIYWLFHFPFLLVRPKSIYL